MSLFLCSEARACMKYRSYWEVKNHVTFVGDSRIRGLYFSLVKLLSFNESVESYKAHSDITFIDDELNVKVVSIKIKKHYYVIPVLVYIDIHVDINGYTLKLCMLNFEIMKRNQMIVKIKQYFS